MNKIQFSEFIEYRGKSNIKAGDGQDTGKYPLFTSSPNISKYLDTYQFSEESLVIGTGGNASIHFVNSPFSTSTDCIVIQLREDFKNKIDIKFVYYYLFGNIWILEKGFKGAGLKHISKNYIGRVVIPLYPLEEQKRLVRVFDLADAISKKRKTSIDLLDSYIKSVFLEMFGDPVTNPMKWQMMKMEDFSDSRLGKMRDKQYITGQYLKPYLGNSNVKWFNFELSNLLEMDFNEQEQIKYSLVDGDLLICEGGEIGRCAIWRNQVDDCYFQKAIHRVRTNRNIIIPEYLQWVLWFYSKGNAFKESRSQATIAHLTGEKLKRLFIPVPKLDLQNKFADLLQNSEKLKQTMFKQSQELHNQFQVLMQKYFSTN